MMQKYSTGQILPEKGAKKEALSDAEREALQKENERDPEIEAEG